MSDEEIKLFPIDKFASNNCDLFLWTITSKIPLCFEILKMWGFRYMDFFALDKQIGVPVNGIYRRVEWILYAYNGKMGINKRGSFIPSIFVEKRKEHSRKPDIVYDVLKTHTREPRIDIFARPYSSLFPKRDGWDVWGNEVQSDVSLVLSTNKEDI